MNIRYLFFAQGLLLLAGCARTKAPVFENAPLILTDSLLQVVRIDTVKLKEKTDELVLNGKVEFDQERVATVAAPFGGTVTEVAVELGDYVDKGQTLAVIRSSEVAEIEKQHVEATQDVAVAERNLREKEDLFNSGLVSEKERLEARQQSATANAELERVKASLALYHMESGAKYRLVAPVAGFVAEKSINCDMQLRSDREEDLLKICGLDDVWVMADVYQSDIRNIREKQQVRITALSYPEAEFTGEIDKIYNMLDAESKTMKVRVKLRNGGHLLKPGMFTTVRVRMDDTVRLYPAVPSDSVIFENGEYYTVVVAPDKKMEIRTVELCGQHDNVSFLKSGVNAGETVICKNALLVFNQLK